MTVICVLLIGSSLTSSDQSSASSFVGHWLKCSASDLIRERLLYYSAACWIFSNIRSCFIYICNAIWKVAWQCSPGLNLVIFDLLSEVKNPSSFFWALEESEAAGEIWHVRSSIRAAIKSKKWGNIHLPSARLEESFTIATAQHGPHGWQVKTLYILTVKAAGTRWIDLQACSRCVAEFHVCYHPLYALNLNSAHQPEQNSSLGCSSFSGRYILSAICLKCSAMTIRDHLRVNLGQIFFHCPLLLWKRKRFTLNVPQR